MNDDIMIYYLRRNKTVKFINAVKLLLSDPHKGIYISQRVVLRDKELD